MSSTPWRISSTSLHMTASGVSAAEWSVGANRKRTASTCFARIVSMVPLTESDPCSAAWAAATSMSVTPFMAESTTATRPRRLSPSMMSTTLRMRSPSATELPPNLRTFTVSTPPSPL